MFKSLSPRMRATLGVTVIVLAFVFAYFFAPRYDDSSSNVTGDAMETPVPTITGMVSSQPVQQNVTIQNVHVAVKQVMLARSFSDDNTGEKLRNPYVVRVLVDTKNMTNQVIGFQYPDIVRLVMPDGSLLHVSLVSTGAVLLPNQSVSGYLDFPVQQPVELSALKLHFTNGKTIAFGAESA